LTCSITWYTICTFYLYSHYYYT